MTTDTLTALDELDRQIGHLVTLGYPAIAQLSEAAFTALFEPLRARAAELPTRASDEDRVPFVVVVKPSLVPHEAALPLTALRGKAGFIDFKPGGLETFGAIDEVAGALPDGPVYVLVDVDTGTETLNVTPAEALETIRAHGRSPLTIEEGIALVTQRPDKLRKNRCFSLLASRSGDKRVPALWISQNRPKLGWCWERNPHTWLGSASCAGRVGGV
ncbi:MAG: DUF5701 family protein [Candidatus Sericytochromatia bacterium]